MSHWPWWMWVMVIGATGFIICKVPIIVDKLRAAGKAKSAEPLLEKGEGEAAECLGEISISEPRALVCSRCGVKWMPQGFPLRDKRKDEAWRARRCLMNGCSGILREPLPGESWPFISCPYAESNPWAEMIQALLKEENSAAPKPPSSTERS